MQRKSSSQGFAHIGLILAAIIVIAAIAFGGWYVWQNDKQNNEPKEANNTAQTDRNRSDQSEKEQGQTQETVDPTVSWVPYSNDEGKFSLKYPSSWKLPRNAGACPKNVLLLGSNDGTVGICQSDKTSQVDISSLAGNQRSAQKPEAGFSNVSETDVTVQGVGGVRYTGMYDTREDIIPYGTKLVRYVFYINDRTYIAEYWQTPDYPDVLNDFEMIITQTLKFIE